MKIEIREMRHVYPTGDEALKGIDLVLEGTDPVAIVGQNGSGKTTLVKHFNRILSPTGGDVRIDDIGITEKTTAQWAKRVGYVFQNPDDQLFLSTVRKELEFGPARVGIEQKRIEETLPVVAQLCGLHEKLEVHPFDLTAAEKKFCTIASVMMMEPDAIVFDEPTCGQDVKGIERLSSIVDYLKSQNKLCITISHDMKFVVDKFTRVVVLCQGKVLLDGTAQEVFSQPEVLKASFVSPPPLARTGQGIGIGKTAFTVEQLIEELKSKKASVNRA